jgi:hypothetical protein
MGKSAGGGSPTAPRLSSPSGSGGEGDRRGWAPVQGVVLTLGGVGLVALALLALEGSRLGPWSNAGAAAMDAANLRSRLREAQQPAAGAEAIEVPAPGAFMLTPAMHQDALPAFPCADLADCYNFTRCRDLDKFPIYMYPWKEESYRLHDLYWPRILMRSARINITTNPEEACLLIPNVDAACPWNVCRQGANETRELLRAQPYWDGGRNHVLFSESDHPPVTCDRAISASGGTWLSSYREGLDASFPLQFEHNMDWTPELAQPGSPRKFLLTFKGHRYPTGSRLQGEYWYFEGVSVRDRLRALHRPPEMVSLHCGGWGVKTRLHLSVVPSHCLLATYAEAS